MARLREFVRGLKEQIEMEERRLRQMRAERNEQVTALDRELIAQEAKIEALRDVVRLLTADAKKGEEE
jgi:hypothetical protein